MKHLIIFLFLTNLAFGQVMKQDKSGLYIATYNIYTFGQHEKAQVSNAAKVLASGSFDLVAIQEVMEDKGEKAINDMVILLKDSFNLNYKAIISENIGDGYKGKERIAFLYKVKSVKPQKINGKPYQIIDVPDGRDFVFTNWKAGKLTFVFGSGHLYYGNDDTPEQKEETLKRRVKELQMVYDFYKNPKEQFGDEDLIFVGDFNRAALVPDYKTVNYDTSLYFIPNIEFFDPHLNEIPEVKEKNIEGKGVPNDNPKLVSTTVADGNTFVYDMIICSHSLLDNFQATRSNGKYNHNFGIIAYDDTDGYGYIPEAKKMTNHNTLKENYSDHRPLWIRLNRTFY